MYDNLQKKRSLKIDNQNIKSQVGPVVSEVLDVLSKHEVHGCTITCKKIEHVYIFVFLVLCIFVFSYFLY